MKKKSVLPSSLRRRTTILKNILVLLGIALVLLAPRLSVAMPIIERTDIFYIPTVLTEREQIEMAVQKQFGNKSDIALAIFEAESGLDTQAHGDIGLKNAPEGSHCFAQINVAQHKDKIQGRDINDIEVCADVARLVYEEVNSFSPWTMYTNGHYKNYLK